MGYLSLTSRKFKKSGECYGLIPKESYFRNNPNESQSPEFLMDYHTSQSSGVCFDKSLSIFIDNKELILNKKVMGKVDPS